MKNYPILLCVAFLTWMSCTQSPNKTSNKEVSSDSLFKNFEARFIDAYWKQFPSAAISAGYFKYADKLKIPDQQALAGDNQFAKNYLDSLRTFSFDKLNDNNKTDWLI